MGSISASHWIAIVIVVAILFGKGRISAIMGDLAEGIRSFRRGVADD